MAFKKFPFANKANKPKEFIPGKDDSPTDESDDLLNANHSPKAVESNGPSVRRLNKLPLIITVAIVSAFAVIVALVAISKGEAQNEGKKEIEMQPDSEMAKATLSHAPEGGIVYGQSDPLLLASAPQSASDPMLTAPPATEANPELPPVDQTAEDIKQAKAEQFKKALMAPTGADVAQMSISNGAQPTSTDQMIAAINQAQGQGAQATGNSDYDQQIARVQAQMDANAAGGAGGSNPMAATTGGGLGSRSPIRSPGSSTVASANEWALGYKNQKMTSQFTIHTGNVIPAILISGINSDIPGAITAQVSRNVYDSATGRYLMIPQGSKLFGSYASGIVYGQNRLGVNWHRIIYPNGQSITLADMPGTTGAGYSGLKDKVNNHYAKIFGGAMLMSLVTATTTYALDRDNSNSNDNNNNNSKSVSQSLNEAFARELGQITSQQIQRSMNVSPTLEIRPGYRMNVMVVKDIELDAPYGR